MEATLLQLGYLGVVYERLKIQEGNLACDAALAPSS